MQYVSITPLLLIGLLTAIAIRVHRTATAGLLKPRGAWSVHGLLLILLGWGITSATLALAGVYRSPRFLALLPGLWLPLIPFVISIGGVLLSTTLRGALRAVADHTTPRFWYLLQALRVLAIGTIFKTIAGEFPIYFALLVGVPDLLFGLSAIIVARRLSRQAIRPGALIAWNAIGVAVILPAVPLIQMGLPGPLQVFTAEPTALKVLEFPMVLAPSVIVPLFMLLNFLLAWRLIELRSGD